MNALTVNQALAQVVRHCCSAEMRAQIEEIAALRKQIAAMRSVIDTLDPNQSCALHRGCCRACFRLLETWFEYCSRCNLKICAQCSFVCSVCRRRMRLCPAYHPARCGKCQLMRCDDCVRAGICQCQDT